MSNTDPFKQAQRVLRRPLRLTRAGLLLERLARAFWPFWCALLLAPVPFAMGLHLLLPAPGGLLLLLGLVAVLGVSAVRGLRRFRWPSAAQARDRLDASMPGRPIAALRDQQVIGAGDGASQQVWQVHLQRMAARAATARAVRPDLHLASRDRYGLRYIALTGFVCALLFGSLWRLGSVTDLGPPGAAQALGPAWEGWAEPPAYTGRPALYLNDVSAPVLELPQGSRITLRLYAGPEGRAQVAQDVSQTPPDISADGLAQAFKVQRSGDLSVASRDWQVLMQRDLPPQVEIPGPLEFGPGGEIRQPFAPSDDYGVVAGSVRIQLDLDAIERRFGLATAPEPRDPIVVDLPMPLSGDRTAFQDVLVENFSEHPWARMPVVMTFEVRDASDQVGQSAPLYTNLGGRRFFDPLARAVAEQRRDILWSRDNARRSVQVLRAISHRPDDVFRKPGLYLKLKFATNRLDQARRAGLTAETRDEIAQVLWDLALELELGDLDDARERLQRAQERLAEAMRNGADQAEIDELMRELREAMNDYMRLLAEEQRQNGEGFERAEDGSGQQLSQDQLQQMMDRIQELMEQGRMDEAMALLQQLNQMMQNLRITEGQGGQGGPGQQALEGLGETLRDQQGLSDEAFRDLQDQFDPLGRNEGQQPGQPGQEPGQQPGQQSGQEPGQPGQQPGDLAQRQRDLRRELERQQQNLPGLGGEEADALRDSLDQAGRAMEQAERNLRDGDISDALDNQAEAMDALRDGIRSLGQALAGQQQQNQGNELGQGGRRSVRDPLNRNSRTDDQVTSDGGRMGTGGALSEEALRLQQEIQRRAIEQERSDQERGYLNRLLNRF